MAAIRKVKKRGRRRAFTLWPANPIPAIVELGPIRTRPGSPIPPSPAPWVSGGLFAGRPSRRENVLAVA